MVGRGRRQRDGGPWGLSDVRKRQADWQKEGWSWESVTLDMVWLSMVTRADCDGVGEGRTRMGRGKGHWTDVTSVPDLIDRSCLIHTHSPSWM